MKKVFLLLACIAVQAKAQTPQTYTTFEGTTLNLYKWEGTYTMILSGTDTLSPGVMTNWINAMDGAYSYYYSCTNQNPICYTDITCIDGKSTIARVDATCGAGCGYLGWTGIELLEPYFDAFYHALATDEQYNQEPFYEFGRNFWFFSDKLEYLSDDPVVTGYAVFMRFMSMDYLGLQGADFGSWTFPQFQNKVKELLNTYMADPGLNWGNTLGAGQGIAGSDLGATDLFASFCFYLKENYGGHAWVQNVWKYAGQRPDALTDQDAVDNFIIASSQAANTNLVSLFQYWKWTPSASAIEFLNSTLGTSGLNQETKHDFVYPNPTRGLLFFDSEIKSINVYSLDGKLLKNHGSVSSIDMGDLSRGIYFIEVTTWDNKSIKAKITKE
jgi:hypothetical protein